MSDSSSVGDDKKPSGAASNAAAVTTSAGTVPSAFSIDGLLGLKQREAADNKTDKEEASIGSTAANSTEHTSQPMAHQASATHLVYSAAAASTMIPSSALRGALWSSHPASIAAFRCKYMQANYF